MLNWDDSYPLALELKKLHPDVNIEAVSLEMVYHWVVELPNFEDDPALCNDEILSAIIQEWFEEAFTL